MDIDWRETKATSTHKSLKEKYLTAFLCDYLEIDVREVDDIAIKDFIEKQKEVELANEAVDWCRHSYVDDSKGLEAMLLGDVADIIYMTTGIKINCEEITKTPTE
jgi:hypothetical protein